MDTYHQFSLFEQPSSLIARRSASLKWPDNARFPHNQSGSKVYTTIKADLEKAEHPLIVTGFAALDYLIEFFGELTPSATTLRVLFGAEPYPGGKQDYAIAEPGFPEVVEQYWLDKGISLRLSGALVTLMEGIREGRVQARYLDSLHAKIYLGDQAVTLGSSNFSASGLRHQQEANARFERQRDPKRFTEARQLAENYWSMGDDFDEHLLALLEKLLQIVPWEEALARSCAELLEGEWAQAYLQGLNYEGATPLWASQRQGIAQALWVLDNLGSVLVADATGSGKTRMGAHLLRALMDRIWSSGRVRKERPVLVCPPAVQESWQLEAMQCGLALDIHSHGNLSNSRSRGAELTLDSVRRGQLLAIDEAHNFLNPGSNRTQGLLRNLADHVVLFTATPINRGSRDLLRLVDILGADNFGENSEVIRRLSRLQETGDQELTEADIEILRREIQRFTVRRTKTMLNAMIDRQPEAYRDKQQRPCRYPRHISKTYPLNETAQDNQCAAAITSLTGQLKGLICFVKPLQLPAVPGLTPEQYLQGRLHSAQRLAAYQIMANLRSSRGALIEHILGTEAACQQLGITEPIHKSETGNIIGRLEERMGRPPENKLGIALPDWLSDPGAHRQACLEEIALYQAILDELAQLSSQREEAKTHWLMTLLEKHPLVLAFDRRLITLSDLRRRILSTASYINVEIATGGHLRAKATVRTAMALGSDTRNLIALCSDSMSEGINLQQASTMVHLDMPSVVRIAEQRVGRVDRMDSPHKEIEVWWPDDGEAFRLRADERFIERHQTVDALIGSNLLLPEAMHPKTLSSREMIAALEREQDVRAWEGLQDAFAPVRALLEGDDALVSQETYEHYRGRMVRVLSRVSVVASRQPWAFFCIAGDRQGAPKWMLFTDRQAMPLTQLQSIAEQLPSLLGAEVQSLNVLDETARYWLNRFLDALRDAERQLLPRRKQCALEEMALVIKHYQKAAGLQGDQRAVDFYQKLLGVLLGDTSEVHPDWNTFADCWLDLIRPAWYIGLKRPGRRRPLFLKDIRRDLLEQPLEFEAIHRAFRSIPTMKALEDRVVACILGAPHRQSGS